MLKDMELVNEALISKNEDQKLIAEEGIKWITTLLKKNQDYGSTVFRTPTLCPKLEPGEAIFVRMSDKIDRIKNLRQAAPHNESLEDSVNDLGAYCLLWLIERAKNG